MAAKGASAILLACALPAAVRAAGEITIVANPGRFGTLEAAATAETQVNWWDSSDGAAATACTESFAATELRHFLARSLHVEEAAIRLSAAGAMPAEGDVFLIGSGDSNPLIAKYQPGPARDPAGRAPEGFRVSALRDNGRTVTIIRGGDRVGSLYGTYAYLERLGVRFYGLGDAQTVFPASPPALPASLDFSEKPDYLTRGFYAWEDRGNTEFFLWMARNRLNLWTSLGSEKKACFLKKLGMKLMSGDHDTQAVCLNPAVYFKDHPDWYGLQDGKRSANIPPHGKGDNFNTSNPAAVAQFAENIIRECIDGRWRNADLLNLWMTDGGRWDQSAGSRALGTPTDRVLLLTYQVRKAMLQAEADGRLKRNVQIATLAYQETLSPPTRPLPADFDYNNCFVTFFPIERDYVYPLADPADTQVNAPLCRALGGWTTGQGRYYSGTVLMGEYYDISSFKTLPLLFTRIMSIDIPWYYRMGVRHFHYMHTPMAFLGTWRLDNYLMARLLWNVDADAGGILGEYFARFYPTTSASMTAFYRELEYASENFKALKSYLVVDGRRYSLRAALSDDLLPLFPAQQLQYDSNHPLVNDGPSVVQIEAAMARARRAIDEALITCRDPAERLRLLEDERRFAYGEATVEFYYRMIRTAMFHRQGDVEQARREFALAERQAGILKSVVDLVHVSFTHANAKDGLDATQAEDAYEHFRTLLAPPGQAR